MSDFDNTNRGAIWVNDNRETDRHPDYKGSANVDGVEYWVACWKRKPGASDRAPVLSFQFEKKEEKGAAKKPSKAPAQKSQEDVPFDDDLPF